MDDYRSSVYVGQHRVDWWKRQRGVKWRGDERRMERAASRVKEEWMNLQMGGGGCQVSGGGAEVLGK